MWHHSENVTPGIADSRDILEGSVWVRIGIHLALLVAIPKENLVLFLKGLEGHLVAMESSFPVRNGNPNGLSDIEFRGDHAFVSLAT